MLCSHPAPPWPALSKPLLGLSELTTNKTNLRFPKVKCFHFPGVPSGNNCYLQSESLLISSLFSLEQLNAFHMETPASSDCNAITCSNLFFPSIFFLFCMCFGALLSRKKQNKETGCWECNSVRRQIIKPSRCKWTIHFPCVKQARAPQSRGKGEEGISFG